MECKPMRFISQIWGSFLTFEAAIQVRLDRWLKDKCWRFPEQGRKTWLGLFVKVVWRWGDGEGGGGGIWEVNVHIDRRGWMDNNCSLKFFFQKWNSSWLKLRILPSFLHRKLISILYSPQHNICHLLNTSVHCKLPDKVDFSCVAWKDLTVWRLNAVQTWKSIHDFKCLPEGIVQ